MRLVRTGADAWRGSSTRWKPASRCATELVGKALKPMQTYKAPLRDMRFVLHELHDSAALTQLRGLGGRLAGADRQHPGRSGKLAEEVLLPTNAQRRRGRLRAGERRRAHAEGLQGGLSTRSARAAGPRSSADPEYGGQGLPESLNKLVEEMICSANLSFSLYPGLTHGAYQAIASHAHGGAEGSLPAEDGGRHLVGHDVPDRGALRHRSRPAAHPRGAAGRRQLQDQRRRRSSSAPASTT